MNYSILMFRENTLAEKPGRPMFFPVPLINVIFVTDGQPVTPADPYAINYAVAVRRLPTEDERAQIKRLLVDRLLLPGDRLLDTSRSAKILETSYLVLSGACAAYREVLIENSYNPIVDIPGIGVGLHYGNTIGERKLRVPIVVFTMRLLLSMAYAVRNAPENGRYTFDEMARSAAAEVAYYDTAIPAQMAGYSRVLYKQGLQVDAVPIGMPHMLLNIDWGGSGDLMDISLDLSGHDYGRRVILETKYAVILYRTFPYLFDSPPVMAPPVEPTVLGDTSEWLRTPAQ